MTKSLVEMCTDIVSAQASHTSMSSEDIVESLRRVFRTLQEVQHLGGAGEPEEGIIRDPGTSIQRNQVLCLECGKRSNSSPEPPGPARPHTQSLQAKTRYSYDAGLECTHTLNPAAEIGERTWHGETIGRMACRAEATRQLKSAM